MNQRYEVTIRGHLTSQLTGIFDDVHIVCLADGNTRITSNPIDQSALYGLLMRLRDLGMTLISVESFSTRAGQEIDDENNPAKTTSACA